MPEFCSTSIDGHVLTVTIERPEVMNSLHPLANAEMGAVFDEFAANPALWVAIVTGRGDRAFSAGNDLKYQAQGGKRVPTPRGFGGLTSRFDLLKPVIAAVNGVAMGGGFEIALACDLIIAADTARFALPEPKVGLAALAGGLHRLPRQIGTKQAMGMILTGRHVPAQEGKELGFVNEVVAAATLLERAKTWAEMICECAPLSIRASMEVGYGGLAHASLAAAMSANYDSVREMAASQDFVEGPRAFAEKRKPNWQGR